MQTSIIALSKGKNDIPESGASLLTSEAKAKQMQITFNTQLKSAPNLIPLT